MSASVVDGEFGALVAVTAGVSCMTVERMVKVFIFVYERDYELGVFDSGGFGVQRRAIEISLQKNDLLLIGANQTQDQSQHEYR